MLNRPLHYGYVEGENVIWVCADNADPTKILPLTENAKNTQCPQCRAKIEKLMENTDGNECGIARIHEESERKE